MSRLISEALETMPNLSGCFSAGDTLDEAIDNAKEAIELWLETVIDDGGTVPSPRLIGEHQTNPEFSGWVWPVVAVDLTKMPSWRASVKRFFKWERACSRISLFASKLAPTADYADPPGADVVAASYP